MQNEVETVKSALKGDTEAFRSLVDAYQKPVYMLVLSSVRDEFQAQDLTQETFIRVYLNLEKLKELSKFGAWICGIARNVTGRWLERHRAIESLDDCLEQNHADFAVKENADIDNDWLWQGVYSLPESLREVILLFYMRSMSRRDIAYFLNISESAVRGRLHKARKLLKEVLEMLEKTVQDKDLPDDFTDKIITEAMKQGEEFLQQKQWKQAKQAFLRVVDIKQDYAPAYRGIGLAARGQAFEQLGKSEHKFDRHLLEEAIEELSRAFRLGDYTPETVWALYWSLRNVSNIDGIIEILKRYAENSPNLEQEFLARHYIVDKYSLIREHEEAVRWHKDLLEKMQNKVSPEKLLSSLSDATMLGSWKECGLLSEWTLLSNGLYSKLEDTYDTCVYRANYLRALIEVVYIPAGRFEEALETCDKLKTMVEKYAEQWVEARWFLADIRGDLLSIYHSTDCKDLEEQIVIDGKQYLLDYEKWIAESSISSSKSEKVYKDPLSGKEEVSSLFDLHRQYYIFSLHDFACMCMWTGHYKDAVELFEKALAISDDAETHFFLAGSILKATGDVEKSFKHFHQAVENPHFSRRHELKLAFLEEATFKDVWDNERFISLIEIEEQKEVQQVKNQ